MGGGGGGGGRGAVGKKVNVAAVYIIEQNISFLRSGQHTLTYEKK